MSNLAIADVETGKQVPIRSQGVLPSTVCDAQRVRERDDVERIGAGPGNCAWHVSNAVMNDFVDDVGRVRMGGGVARLETAALVDGDVDKHRALFHRLEHVSGD